jgi:hypothetical protein
LFDWPKKPPSRSIGRLLLDHPVDLIVNPLIAEALPGAALSYGVVWLAMRPRGGKKLRNPALRHLLGIVGVLFCSAAFRLGAAFLFAGEGAFSPEPGSPAGSFYVLILPALFAAAYFYWMKQTEALWALTIRPDTLPARARRPPSWRR